VDSRGNTYEDNQYCGVDVSLQSTFRSGRFLPREPGHPANLAERDVITERGCVPSTGAGCFTNDFGPVAMDVFNGGTADLRNTDVNGEIDVEVQSSFRVDGDADIQGNIHLFTQSAARLRNRFGQFGGDREVTYSGALECDGSSQTWGSNVQCGETCSGAISGSCGPTP
jgi:hypothetical protein